LKNTCSALPTFAWLCDSIPSIRNACSKGARNWSYGHIAGCLAGRLIVADDGWTPRMKGLLPTHVPAAHSSCLEPSQKETARPVHWPG
jgi:hypothetical protein